MTAVNCPVSWTALPSTLTDRTLNYEVNEHSPNLSLERLTKRIHVALPIRVTCWDANRKPSISVACTYDISAHGARITGLQLVKNAGEIISVERARNKALCRVVWIGEAGSELQGQIGIQAVDAERFLWEAELRDMEEVYEAIQREGFTSNLGGDKRQHPRFPVEGLVELPQLSGGSQKNAELKNLSEFGCLVETRETLAPGANFKMVLNVANYDLTLKGCVRHRTLKFGIGIEFQEIRKGDRQVLQYLLRRLNEQQKEATPALARVAVASL